MTAKQGIRDLVSTQLKGDVRWYDRDSNWILTPAEAEQQHAEQERRRSQELEATLTRYREQFGDLSN